MTENIWRRGSLTKNPYKRTAFRVARVPRDVVRHRTIVQLIGQTKRIVSADTQAHTIGGEPVSEAELNAAEQILLDPRQRIVEELLEHATERPRLERVHRLAREAVAAMAAEDTGRLPVTNLRGLQSWAQALVQEYMDGVLGADPSFGALELDLVPPFGRSEEV